MGTRVLLIEQDEVTRSSLVRAMRARGIGVDAFASGPEALSAVRGGAVWTRALVDLNLPEMDGVAVVEEILRELPDLEVTFSASGSDAGLLCRAQRLGTVLWKPLGLGPVCERFAYTARRSGTQLKRVVVEGDAARASVVPLSSVRR